MIPVPNANGKTFYVLGFGKSGKASAAALRASGATLWAWDDQEKGQKAIRETGYTLTPPAQVDWTQVTALVMAPGIPLTHPKPHAAVPLARAAGIPILSDIDLLFAACPKATFVGITGTNGKSTTTALIAHILTDAGRKVQVGGNIGTPALSLEPLGADGFYVLELSSYLLDLIQSNPIKVAVLLNITPDHYDRHGGLEGYIDAKMNIASRETPQTLILGTDEPETKSVMERLIPYRNIKLHELSTKHDVTCGIHIKDRMLYVKGEKEPVDITACSTLPGLHNAQNAAAAYATCRALGLSRTAIEEGLRSFPGLDHRQQLVAEIDGVRFINDSKATNADAASKALVCYETIYWIIGGRPKVGGLSGLEELMAPVAHAFLIGEASDAFALWCEARGVPFTKCGTLDVACENAAAMAFEHKRKGSVVLLSPACASWDQFDSFEARGAHFAALVNAMKKRA